MGSTYEEILKAQIKTLEAGSKTIAAGATKYLHIDSGIHGAEIIGMLIKGVVGADWTLDIYVPVDDGVAAPAAEDKRNEITYINTDTEGGMIEPFGFPFNCFFDFTNDSGAPDDIDDVIVVYRSADVLSLTWET